MCSIYSSEFSKPNLVVPQTTVLPSTFLTETSLIIEFVTLSFHTRLLLTHFTPHHTISMAVAAGTKSLLAVVTEVNIEVMNTTCLNTAGITFLCVLFDAIWEGGREGIMLRYVHNIKYHTHMTQ